MFEPLLYDSVTESLQYIKSADSDKITVYFCGVTVYDYCHLGHGRIKIFFDLLKRFWNYLGYESVFVSNITDIDDKILNKAKNENVPWQELVLKYIKAMEEDDNLLNLLPLDASPRATSYINEMIDFVAKLLEMGKAYQNSDGDICLSIDSVENYGKISKQKIKNLICDKDVNKINACDFVLWKKSKQDEVFWDAPWGNGRPGWHLECSVMVESVLSHPITWHGGGVDLKFPHHENECAQSEALFSSTFSLNWVHVGLIDNNGQKMSKSLGNTVLLRDAIKKYGSNILRLFFLSTHYRKPISYMESSLQQASSRYEKYQRSLVDIEFNNEIYDDIWSEYINILCDDFNTPLALVFLDSWSKEAVNDNRYKNMLHNALNIFGINFKLNDDDVSCINEKILERNDAKTRGDYVKADQIRQELKSKGIIVSDNKNGSSWYRI